MPPSLTMKRFDMNNRLYGNLIFELSKCGRKAYSLPKKACSEHSTAELPAVLRRQQAAELPECDELTVVTATTTSA